MYPELDQLLLPEFQAYIRALKGHRSPQTVRIYRSRLRWLSRKLQERGLKPLEVTEADLTRLREDTFDEITPSMWNQTLHAVTRFYEEAVRRGEIAQSPLIPRLFRQETPKPPREPLTQEVLDGILAAARKEGMPWPLVIQVMAFAGLRRDEVCRLRRQHLLISQYREDHEDPSTAYSLWVLGKGNKGRSVAIHRSLYEAIEAYLAWRTHEMDDHDEHMFVYYHPGSWRATGKPRHPRSKAEPHPLTGDLIWRRVREFARDTANPRVTPHDLRAHFATRALMRGVPPSLVKLWMGHSHERTTMGYFRPAGDTIAAIPGIILADVDLERLERECRELLTPRTHHE